MGCARQVAAVVPPQVSLPRVEVSPRRVIDITVGLRPYRARGPRVELQIIDDKRIVHHYGHGGAGMSLSWGTAHAAAELAVPPGTLAGPVAVLGAGVAGLTAARQLQRRGAQVRLIAAALPPDTTSNRSLATWTPTSGVVSAEHRSAAFASRFEVQSGIAYAQLQRLVGQDYGVSWIDTYVLRQGPRPSRPGRRRLAPSVATQPLEPHQHPFATHAWVGVRPTLRIETDREGFFYMAPRSDGIVLGGSAIPHETSLTPDEGITKSILEVFDEIMDFGRFEPQY